MCWLFMKSLTFSYGYEIEFNLYRILLKNCSERQLFPKLVRNRKKLLQMPKVAKKLPSTIGKGLKEGGGGRVSRRRQSIKGECGKINCQLLVAARIFKSLRGGSGNFYYDSTKILSSPHPRG